MASIPTSQDPTLPRVAASAGAGAAVLAITRFAPSFAFLGPRGALLGWLAFVTIVTAAVPGVVTFVGFKLPLSAAGLGWGWARRDAGWIALGVLGAAAAAAVVSRAPGMRAYYPQYAFVKAEPLLWIPSTLAFAAYGLAWETLFRGHLLLALVGRDGEAEGGATGGGRRRAWIGALLVLQTLLFATGHLDKPFLEAALSVPAGLFFGLVALRTRSVLPGFLLHFTLSTGVNLFCAYG